MDGGGICGEPTMATIAEHRDDQLLRDLSAAVGGVNVLTDEQDRRF